MTELQAQLAPQMTHQGVQEAKPTLLDRIVFLFRPLAQARRISESCTAFLRKDGRIMVKHAYPGNVQYHPLGAAEARALAATLLELADAAEAAGRR